MGGCTSKPKVLKDDGVEAPEPAPEKVGVEEKGTLAGELAPQQGPEKAVEEDKEVVAEAPEPVASEKVEKEEEEALNAVVDGVENKVLNITIKTKL